MGYDFSKKYMDKWAMDQFAAIDNDIGRRYGAVVRAIPLSNREYQHRYDKLKDSRNMKRPPSSERIFPGYLAIRRFGTKQEYETWVPDDAFEEMYKAIE